MLGSMHEDGQGTSQNFKQAVWWYRKAAERGHEAAQIFLARMYEDGRGVPQDYGQAVRWYRMAAEQGTIGESQYSLGRMYMQGHGVPRDYVQAHLWFNLAASQFPSGKYQEAAAQARDLVAARMPPAQVAEAQRLAREWKPKRP
jgi:TPR repeat protein